MAQVPNLNTFSAPFGLLIDTSNDNTLSDHEDDDSLLDEANNDTDTRLHGCKTVEELSFRLDQLSEQLLVEETDPILQIVAFTGEASHPWFRSNPLKRDRDFNLRFKVIEYSRFAACRDRNTLRRALEAGFPELPSCILKPGECVFSQKDVSRILTETDDDGNSLSVSVNQSGAPSPLPTSHPLPAFEPVSVSSMPAHSVDPSVSDSPLIPHSSPQLPNANPPLGLDLNVDGLNFPSGVDSHHALGLHKPPGRRPSVARRSSLISRPGSAAAQTLTLPSSGPRDSPPSLPALSVLDSPVLTPAPADPYDEDDVTGLSSAAAAVQAPLCSCLQGERMRPGSLLLGGSAAARHHMLLEQQGVRLVLNTARVTGCEADHAAHTAQLSARGVGYVGLSWLDHNSQVIAPDQLAACIRLIHRARLVPIVCRCRADTDMAGPVRCASVLVHCSQGRSRSAALVTAYVAAVQGVSVAAALQLVQARRSIANPNLGFQRQLQALESTGFFRALHRELRQLTGARQLALDTPTLTSPTAHTPLCIVSPRDADTPRATPRATPRVGLTLVSPRHAHAHDDAADYASPVHVRQKRRFFPSNEDVQELDQEETGISNVVDDMHALSIDL